MLGALPSTQLLSSIRAALGSSTLRDCTTIVVAALLVAAGFRPFQDTPFIDDWVYSWSVQHLIETHEFLFPELVGNPIAAQVLWGALFCLPFGFSLTALRVSTWTLGVLALCASYLLVSECGGTRRSALMAAAVLGFYPVFLIMSPTFMTDVPFVAAMLWSALLFVRALLRRRVALVWLAAAVCAASAGSRVIGVGVAGAMIATLLFHPGRWGRRVHGLLAPALVVPFAVW
ncbi:MAG: glycosyltransferase family 39 protein, partial [Acidobacteria bacterium]|nr:glycosyltransferase family 39 protein [Acidobacteriota bacterium]